MKKRGADADVDMEGRPDQTASFHHSCDVCGNQKTGSHPWFEWFCYVKKRTLYACEFCAAQWFAEKKPVPEDNDLSSSGASGSKDVEMQG
jgi:hypothetical protein